MSSIYHCRQQESNFPYFVCIDFNGKRNANTIYYVWVVKTTVVIYVTYNALWLNTKSWWRNQVETCPRYQPFAPEIHTSQSLVTQSVGVFFDLHLNKRLCEQSRRRWFEALWRPWWRHSDGRGHKCFNVQKSCCFRRRAMDLFVVCLKSLYTIPWNVILRCESRNRSHICIFSVVLASV